MFTRPSVLTMGTAILSLAIGVSSLRAWDRLDRRTRVTFSASVALPGITLNAGTYVFEIANPESTSDIVRVRGNDYTRVYYTGFTRRIGRPAELAANRPITFGEAQRGVPPPIAAWYPSGEASGHEFIYVH